MKKNWIFFVLLMAFAHANAQYTYDKSIGIRLGNGPGDFAGLSYKQFVQPKGAIEVNAIFSNRKNWFGLFVSGAYQHHHAVLKVPGLKWYWGGGITGGQTFSDIDTFRQTVFGIFPTAGLDYKIKSVPLNISLDIRPVYYIAGLEGFNTFYVLNFGLAVRYTF